MERLVASLSSLSNVLLALNDSEGELILLERIVTPKLHLLSTKTFTQVASVTLPLTFPPAALCTHRDWLCIWGNSHGHDHIAVLALSSPSALELLSPPLIPVQEAKWHPLADDWLAVLYADFYLRVYDMAWKPVPKIVVNVALTLGYDCWPVSFVFSGDTQDATFYRFGCYFLLKDGSIYALNPLLPERFRVEESFHGLNEAAKACKLTRSEPRLSDWLLSLSSTARKDSVGQYNLSLSSELRSSFTAFPTGLRPSCHSSYSRLYCLHPSQPFVLAAVQDTGRIDLLCSFADCIPNFTAAYEVATLVEVDTVEFGEVREAGELVGMMEMAYLYRVAEKVYELDGHWISELRRRYETKSLLGTPAFSAPPVLITALEGLCSALYLQTRLREQHILLSTPHEIQLIPTSGALSAPAGVLVDTRTIVPSAVSADAFKPKAQGLLTVAAGAQSASVTEARELPELLAQMTKLVDQMMETRVIPITKRTKFLVTLLSELATRRKDDEASIAAIEACVTQQFRDMTDGLDSKLQIASKNCQSLRNNIEVITQKLNRLYLPLSSQELDIQMRVKRLHTLTEQLKVEAQTRRAERCATAAALEVKRCVLRFPAGGQVRDLLAVLARLSSKLEDVENSLSL